MICLTGLAWLYLRCNFSFTPWDWNVFRDDKQPWKCFFKLRITQNNRPASYLSFQHQVLSLPILQHLKRLQGAHDVHRINSCFLTDLCGSKQTYITASKFCICSCLFKTIFSGVNKPFPPATAGRVHKFCVFSLTFDRDLLALEIVHVSQ